MSSAEAASPAMTSDQKAAVTNAGQSRQDGVLGKHLQGKEKEWLPITDRKRPLQLLGLPVDILEAIIREITHTNDLTSLALTHSALHALVIPHIYSRFDIVWPDVHSTSESRVGVDALTYGLATLVMAQDVFGEAPSQRSSGHQVHKCAHCGRINQCSHLPRSSRPRKTRRGNYFAQYTRKFSLGNGPAAWVQDYAITKEAGKMLGTLVALAVGRMRNLEAFVWDMPTGVLRDVWLALASLGDREDGQECRLERVWVRWHDNSEQGHSQSSAHSSTVPTLMVQSHIHSVHSIPTGPPPHSLFHIPPYPRVEFPTFSVLPALKSLSVLDIDELPYAEEMSVLIETSVLKLEELRLGVAQHAQFENWIRPAEDRSYIHPPIAPSANHIPKSGGILGLLFSRCCDVFRSTHLQEATCTDVTSSTSMISPMAPNQPELPPPSAQTEIESVEAHQDQSAGAPGTSRGAQDGIHESEDPSVDQPSDIENLTSSFANQGLGDDTRQHPVPDSSSSYRVAAQPGDGSDSSVDPAHPSSDPFSDLSHDSRANWKLRLKMLELERVPVSVAVLSRAIDWSQLTTLTLLGCRNHEQLWKALRKRFTPPSRARNTSVPAMSMRKGIESIFGPSQTASSTSLAVQKSDYFLKICRLHTDCVSAALINFIRDTLAPDSLEWLFLQESVNYKSPVTIDMIYKGAIRRHRGSLQKLLIDSELRVETETPDSNWRRWIYSKDLLTAITSGRMRLNELSMSIDYQDWHYFLQRLPNAKKLRALHISHIAEHVHGRVDSREAALQVLDIVALRPELELCYLGVQAKCFEVLEYPAERKPAGRNGSNSTTLGTSNIVSEIESEEEDWVSDGIAGVNIVDQYQAGDVESDMEVYSVMGGETSDEEASTSGAKAAKTFRLREILFYDDKVSIFKARHGKL